MTRTMTLSELTDFDQYCTDNNISKREGFSRFDISEYTYYKSRRIRSSSTIAKNSNKKEASTTQETITKQETSSKSTPTNKPGRFIPLDSASAPTTPTMCTQPQNQSHLVIDINMGAGTEVRISGDITTNTLREVLITLSNSSSHV